MERYRSGHNGPDSKSLLLRGTPSPEVLIYQGFQHPLSEFSGEFSPKILLFSPDFGSSLLIWSGIEVVITGLTRNRSIHAALPFRKSLRHKAFRMPPGESGAKFSPKVLSIFRGKNLGGNLPGAVSKRS